MTPEVFGRYLEFIRGLVENQKVTLHLLLDVYPVHTQAAAQNRAQSFNIVLHFIPPGLTDQYQPLDR
jgi:hypothetical protein